GRITDDDDLGLGGLRPGYVHHPAVVEEWSQGLDPSPALLRRVDADRDDSCLAHTGGSPGTGTTSSSPSPAISWRGIPSRNRMASRKGTLRAASAASRTLDRALKATPR